MTRSDVGGVTPSVNLEDNLWNNFFFASNMGHMIVIMLTNR